MVFILELLEILELLLAEQAGAGVCRPSMRAQAWPHRRTAPGLAKAHSQGFDFIFLFFIFIFLKFIFVIVIVIVFVLLCFLFCFFYFNKKNYFILLLFLCLFFSFTFQTWHLKITNFEVQIWGHTSSDWSEI